MTLTETRKSPLPPVSSRRSRFSGSKHEARVAREMFVMDLMAHMHDPNFLVTGNQRGVCTDSMLAVAHVSNNYMFRRKGKGTPQESPSRMETLRTALEGKECTTEACDAARALCTFATVLIGNSLPRLVLGMQAMAAHDRLWRARRQAHAPGTRRARPGR